MSETEIALFPIPGSVSLPLSKVPLHVFEPRYRKMIQDSVADKRRIAVAHTQKILAEAKLSPNTEPAEMLNKNQNTYLAHPIFSAGFAKIIETLLDGRMLVEIEMDQRYQMLEELQSVPYKIVRCRTFLDDAEAPPVLLRKRLDQILIKLADDAKDNELKEHLKSNLWLNQTDFEYSFKIYRIVVLDPDLMQKVLELKRASERIGFLIDILTRNSIH